MAVVCALVLAVVGALFAYLALQEGGLSLTPLNLAAYYVTVAFIALALAMSEIVTAPIPSR